jgi:hypothetical protein
VSSPIRHRCSGVLPISGRYAYPPSIDLDGNGNVLLATYLQETGTVSGIKLKGETVLKVDPAGKVIWTRALSLRSSDTSDHPIVIAASPNGEAFIGRYAYSLDHAVP